MIVFSYCFFKCVLFCAAGLLILLLASCEFKDNSYAKTETNLAQIAEKSVDEFLEIPKGNELKIETQKIGTNEFNVKVTNVSNRKVYCYYTKSLSGDRASFHYYPEKRRKASDNFEKYNGVPDSLPSLSTINPNDLVEFSFSVLEKGEYRLTISYLIDENTAKIMTEKIPPEWTQSEEETVLKSIKQIVTPVMIAE